jgi:probable F420-dependent oxidoreductase
MKVGIVLPISENRATGRTAPYALVRSMAKQAEASGFDSIWVFDHLLSRRPDEPTGGIWECWTILTALAEATERVELGTLVLCGPFRNPALLAKMADTFDEVSGGRLILGLGAGWHKPEFDAFGYPFDHLANRFEEALKIIVPLLREGKVDFHGQYSSAVDCELRPRGPRPGGPPILVAGLKPRMLRLTAEYADSWNTAWMGSTDVLIERRTELEAACAEVGRDPRTLEVTVGLNVNYEQREEPLDPKRALFGSAEEVATGLKAHADEGVGHAICNLSPNTPESLERLGEVLKVYRQLVA